MESEREWEERGLRRTCKQTTIHMWTSSVGKSEKSSLSAQFHRMCGNILCANIWNRDVNIRFRLTPASLNFKIINFILRVI